MFRVNARKLFYSGFKVRWFYHIKNLKEVNGEDGYERGKPAQFNQTFD